MDLTPIAGRKKNLAKADTKLFPPNNFQQRQISGSFLTVKPVQVRPIGSPRRFSRGHNNPSDRKNTGRKTMPRTNPQTPLARLINPRLSTLGFSRVELMHKLGYANTGRGLRRFDDFLATGRITTHLLKNLPDVLGLDTLNVEDAAATTRQQIADAEEAAARERFRPHIIVLANRQDGKHIPVFVKAWIWRNRVIGLPDDFGGLSSSQQMKQATRIV
ncbi:MAG: hypothetical protein FVQ80_17825, partial [Planctomycetes bacterium]|nr:hypothetical protein [Planctomycetota bacterium]